MLLLVGAGSQEEIEYCTPDSRSPRFARGASIGNGNRNGAGTSCIANWPGHTHKTQACGGGAWNLEVEALEPAWSLESWHGEGVSERTNDESGMRMGHGARIF